MRGKSDPSDSHTSHHCLARKGMILSLRTILAPAADMIDKLLPPGLTKRQPVCPKHRLWNNKNQIRATSCISLAAAFASTSHEAAEVLV